MRGGGCARGRSTSSVRPELSKVRDTSAKPVWGTPEKCYETIVDNQKRIGNDRFVGVFSYAGMSHAESERNMRLFARAVMPELQKYAV